MARLVAEAIGRCDLRLNGLKIITEAATGAYVVTPIMAAAAGAEVVAVTRKTRYGTVAEVRQRTMELARLCNVTDRVHVMDELPAATVAEADIVTNSGHVRPIDAKMIARMRTGAVIPLMYESWEFRASDVDLESCYRRGIAVAGTNECHPAVSVFSFLGIMAAKLLLDAGVGVYGANILILCDNPFTPFLKQGLEAVGASVQIEKQLDPSNTHFDAILVANTPGDSVAIGAREAELIAKHFPGAVVAEFWGGIDRPTLAAQDVPYWPFENILSGHMGILPSAVGPEPVVRLQCAGLKVGEIMARASAHGVDPVEAAVRSGFGQALALVTA
jgi:hypothetical protein